MIQLIRYGLVGVSSNFAVYCVYLLITYYGIEPKIAMTMMYIIGALFGFVGHRRWSFAHNGDYKSAALRFVMAHLFGYLLNFMILFTFVDRLGYAHQWIQAAAIIIVAGVLFLAYKYFVFPEEALHDSKI